MLGDSIMNWFKKAEQKISYTAIVLDSNSHDLLLKNLSPFIPEGWKTYSHHMTINMGSAKDKSEVGNTVSLTATQWAKDEKAIAVMIEGYQLKDARTPHVTVAVNIEGGGKPKDSNGLKGWQPLSNPVSLTGVIQEVPAS